MHYMLAVITKEKPNDEIMTDMLVPYDQNLKVEPYVESSYEELKEYFQKNSDWFDEKDELLEALENDDIGTIRYLNLKHCNDITGIEDINKNGEAISTHNPNSKWDSWRVLDINTSFLGIQQLSQLKDILRPLEADSEIETGKKFPDMNHHYREQLKWDKDFRSGWYETHYPTLFDYICYRLPYDIVFPDGSWHSYDRGGIDVNRVYCKTFYDILDGFPQDYWLTLVDCHI